MLSRGAENSANRQLMDNDGEGFGEWYFKVEFVGAFWVEGQGLKIRGCALSFRVLCKGSGNRSVHDP